MRFMYGAILTMIAGHHMTDLWQASDATTRAPTCAWRMGVQVGFDP